ncbi:MAG: hypothetical protein JNL01_07390 [Bdellovibrionales bacterium]|nr:hypothetical protein [Bdellovibrionales bacterium]
MITVAFAATAVATLNLPQETSRYIDGKNSHLVQAYCLSCHSADYVTTQPRGQPRAFWEAVVQKMKKAYGAEIPDKEIRTIVDSLTETYGRKN